jgi:hypothetical protein
MLGHCYFPVTADKSTTGQQLAQFTALYNKLLSSALLLRLLAPSEHAVPHLDWYGSYTSIGVKQAALTCARCCCTCLRPLNTPCPTLPASHRYRSYTRNSSSADFISAWLAGGCCIGGGMQSGVMRCCSTYSVANASKAYRALQRSS